MHCTRTIKLPDGTVLEGPGMGALLTETTRVISQPNRPVTAAVKAAKPEANRLGA